ncbi:hypothetical protein AcW1_008423 [Taiwanofungus camphoratus]|nr:hypothetical protein AcV5_008715 [Antrodia cinnamomea]KAI0951365.1 hypothetical protein AcW1_008423 [Antrodia cinnamomea]KAI0956271.1 hypothetical protein AcV7_006713 [Antrodia cinnamomea]
MRDRFPDTHVFDPVTSFFLSISVYHHAHLWPFRTSGARSNPCMVFLGTTRSEEDLCKLASRYGLTTRVRSDPHQGLASAVLLL